MTDFRALCAELLDWAERTSSHYYKQPDVILRARTALAEEYEAEANNPPEGHPDPEPFQLILRERAAALRAALAQPEPPGLMDEEPTDQEIEEWADAAAEVPLEEMDPEVHGWRRCFKSDQFSETIRAALRRWGNR